MAKNFRSDYRACIRKISFLLSLILLLSIFTSCVAPDPVVEKERLENRIENIDIAACDTVVECLASWKFPKGYDVKKIRAVEQTMKKGYYRALDAREMAAEAADCFMRLYYDRIAFSDTDAYTNALIQCLVLALHDDYAVYRTADEYAAYTDSMSGSFDGIGVTVRKNFQEGTICVTRLVMNSPAQRAGVLVGDLIYSVEGVLVTNETIEEAFSAMLGDAGEPANFTVLRNGELISFSILRENMENMTVSYSISEDKVAYISISSFKKSTYQYFEEAVRSATEAGAVGFIFDVRDNPGGYLSSVLNVLERLAPEGVRLFSRGPENGVPTIYMATEPDAISVPCVVICSESTASAAELFTAALRDYDDMGVLSVTVVGTAEATYGKGIMQSSYHLADGSVLTMTSDYYNPPCGENYHGKGVVPDVVCEESAVLDAARQALFDLIDNK